MAAASEVCLTSLPPAVQIKNTFIHIVDSNEDDTPSRPMMTAVKTQPVPWTDFSESLALSTAAGCSPRSRLLLDDELMDVQCNTTCRPSFNSSTDVDSEVTSEASLTDSDCPSIDLYQLGEKYALNIVVKNTFFDVDFNDVEEGKPIFAKTKTEPLRLSSSRNFESLKDSPRHFQSSEATEGVDAASVHCADALGDRPVCVQGDATDLMPSEKEESMSLEMAQSSNSSVPDRSTAQSPMSSEGSSTHPPVIVPAADRQPEYSAGSAFHATGQCKPCAWFWRPQGCLNSTECQHCHLCNRGELRKVKKANMQLAKRQGKQSYISNQCNDVKVAASMAAVSPAPWVGLVVFAPALAPW